MTQMPEPPADPSPEAGTVTAKDGSVVIVRQEDTVGVVLLGLLAFVLLAALLRAEGRNRTLLARLPRAPAERA